MGGDDHGGDRLNLSSWAGKCWESCCRDCLRSDKTGFTVEKFSPREVVVTVNVIEGRLVTESDQFAIVVSRFNELITSRLLDGAIDTLCRHGSERSHLTVVHVPGAFEIPL